MAIGVLIIVFNTSSGYAKTNTISKVDKINDLISRYADYGKFNGSVLVAHEGKVIYKKGFGLANMEWDIPNQTDTKFRIASITKQFTAMLIVQLVAENKLDLHVPISTYLPNYPKKNSNRITIHHLLTHTSGTPEFDDFINYRDIERDRYRPEEMLNIFQDGELQFTPGGKFAYTNTGYVTLGVIIEKVTGKSYAQVLKEKIFNPLRMYNSGFDDNRIILKNRALGYTNGYARKEYFNVNYIDMSIPYAAGSIYSTVEDLSLWDQSLYTENLVAKKFMDLLFGEYINTRNRYYGYGWFMANTQVGSANLRVKTQSHGGGMNGFKTLITRAPSSKSLVILLSNLETSPQNELTRTILGIINDKPYDPKISIAYSLLDVIANDGVKKAGEYYKKVKGSIDHYIDVDEMNIAAYELLHSNKIQKAGFMFKLNVEAFPNSFIVYDSYGELLLQLGNKSAAIENYKKSVELNPNNRNAVNILKNLDIE